MRIRLTRGYTVRLDTNQHAKAMSFTPWHVAVMRRRDGTIKTRYAAHSLPGHRTLLLHQLLAGGADNRQVNFVNGDGLDCRMKNLRRSTQTQASQRCRLNRRNRSGVRGVHWSVRYQCWVAQICIHGRQTLLLRTPNFGAACRARRAAERKYGYKK